MEKTLRLSFCLVVVSLLAGCSQNDDGKPCEPGCENGIAVSCDENGVRHEMGCPNGCDGLVCKADTTTPGVCTPSCNDGIAVICNSDGTSKEVGCPNGCDGVVCKADTTTPGVCTPSCNDGVAVICNSDGTSKEVGCPDGCDGNTCKSGTMEPVLCTPSCNDGVAVICNSDGTSKEVGCPNGCDGDVCKVEEDVQECVASCSDGVQVTCENGTKIEKSCGELGCDGDVCKVEEDVSGSQCIHGVDAQTGECKKIIEEEGNPCDASFKGECRDGMAVSCVKGKIQAEKCYAKACMADGAEAVCYVDCPFEDGTKTQCETGSVTYACHEFGGKQIYDYKGTVFCNHGCSDEDGKCIVLTEDEGRECNEKTFTQRCDGDIKVDCYRGRVRASLCIMDVCTVVNGVASCSESCDEEKNEYYCSNSSDPISGVNHYSSVNKRCQYDDNHKLYRSSVYESCPGICVEETGKCKDGYTQHGKKCTIEEVGKKVCDGDLVVSCEPDFENLMEEFVYSVTDCTVSGMFCGEDVRGQFGCLVPCDNPDEEISKCSGMTVSSGICLAGKTGNYAVFDSGEICLNGCDPETNQCKKNENECGRQTCGTDEVCQSGMCLPKELLELKEGDDCDAMWDKTFVNSFCNGDKRVSCGVDQNTGKSQIVFEDCSMLNGCTSMWNGRNAYCRGDVSLCESETWGQVCQYADPADKSSAFAGEYYCSEDYEDKPVVVVENIKSCARGCDVENKDCEKVFEGEGEFCISYDYLPYCINNLLAYCDDLANAATSKDCEADGNECMSGICLTPEMKNAKDGDNYNFAYESFCIGDQLVKKNFDEEKAEDVVEIVDCSNDGGCSMIMEYGDLVAGCRGTACDSNEAIGCGIVEEYGASVEALIQYMCVRNTDKTYTSQMVSYQKCAHGCDAQKKECTKLFEDEGAFCNYYDFDNRCEGNLSITCEINQQAAVDCGEAGCNEQTGECYPKEGEECRYYNSICKGTTSIECKDDVTVYTVCEAGCNEQTGECFPKEGDACDYYGFNSGCNGNTLVTCVDDVVVYTSCGANECLANLERCAASDGDDCSESFSYCLDNKTTYCDGATQKVVVKDCGENVCLPSTGRCRPALGEACNFNLDAYCKGDDVFECGEDNVVVSQSCNIGCYDGQCIEEECEADSFEPLCSENISYYCDSNGKTQKETCGEAGCDKDHAHCSVEPCKDVTCPTGKNCNLGVCVSPDMQEMFASCDPQTFVESCGLDGAYYCDYFNEISRDYCDDCGITENGKFAFCGYNVNQYCNYEGQILASSCDNGIQEVEVCMKTTDGRYVAGFAQDECDEQGCRSDNSVCIAVK